CYENDPAHVHKRIVKGSRFADPAPRDVKRCDHELASTGFGGSGDSGGMTEPQSFEEFCPYYVSQHKNPISRKLHFAGTTIAMGCLAIAPFNPAALLAAPVAGYGLA